MEEQMASQLAADIAANVVKATAATTARDLQIQKLEINYQAMFDQNTKEHSSITDALKNMAEKIDSLVDKMDGRYAKSWTEKAWIWLFTSAGVVIIGLLIRWLLLLELK